MQDFRAAIEAVQQANANLDSANKIMSDVNAAVRLSEQQAKESTAELAAATTAMRWANRALAVALTMLVVVVLLLLLQTVVALAGAR